MHKKKSVFNGAILFDNARFVFVFCLGSWFFFFFVGFGNTNRSGWWFALDGSRDFVVVGELNKASDMKHRDTSWCETFRWGLYRYEADSTKAQWSHSVHKVSCSLPPHSPHDGESVDCIAVCTLLIQLYSGQLHNHHSILAGPAWSTHCFRRPPRKQSHPIPTPLRTRNCSRAGLHGVADDRIQMS